MKWMTDQVSQKRIEEVSMKWIDRQSAKKNENASEMPLCQFLFVGLIASIRQWPDEPGKWKSFVLCLVLITTASAPGSLISIDDSNTSAQYRESYLCANKSVEKCLQ